MSATKLRQVKAIVIRSSKAGLTIKQMLELLEPSCCNGNIIHVSKPDGSRYRAYTDVTTAIYEMFKGIGSECLVSDIVHKQKMYFVAFADYKDGFYYSFGDRGGFGRSCDFDDMFDLVSWFEPEWHIVEEGDVLVQRSRWSSRKK